MSPFDTISVNSGGWPVVWQPGERKLVGEWQDGPETILGCASQKLRLSFATSSYSAPFVAGSPFRPNQTIQTGNHAYRL